MISKSAAILIGGASFISTLLILPPALASSSKQLPTVTIKCGDTLVQSAKIANDLQCPTETESALKIVGDNIVIDGQGHSISAPIARNGISVHGSNVQITSIQVHGVKNGNGLFAYDCPGIRLSENDFSKNEIGIMMYAEFTQMIGIQITGNTASSNSQFGIRATSGGGGAIVQPHIAGNDLEKSGDYALYVQATSYEVTAEELNLMTLSNNGIFLSGGDFSLHDFSLSDQNIQNVQIFVENAQSVTVNNVNLSTSLTHQAGDKSIGLDIYRAQSFHIQNLTSLSNDVGIKLETEKNTSPNGKIVCSSFGGNFVAGVMLSSYDNTPYGTIIFDSNAFQEAVTAQDVYVDARTKAFTSFITEIDCNGNFHK
jgi:hypothetical protein